MSVCRKTPEFVFAAVTVHFSFFPCLCGGKTPCKRKTAYSAVFQGYWGEYPRSITTDCRLWRIKGGRYGAAVKENSRSKRLFSVCSARVGSAVRKSVIFERAAFPSKLVYLPVIFSFRLGEIVKHAVLRVKKFALKVQRPMPAARCFQA